MVCPVLAAQGLEGNDVLVSEAQFFSQQTKVIAARIRNQLERVFREASHSHSVVLLQIEGVLPVHREEHVSGAVIETNLDFIRIRNNDRTLR